MNAILHSEVQAWIGDGYFPGAVCYAEQSGRMLFHESFGWAAVRPKRIPMHRETLFDLASITKIFTSTIILQLADEGRISLDMPLERWFPELHCLTVRQLLAHCSGLPAWIPFYALVPKDGILSCIAEMASQSERQAERQVIYSDLNFILLGMLIEALDGCSLNEAVARRIARPLRMQSVQYNPDAWPYPIAATEWGNRIEMRMVGERGLSYAGWREEVICGQANDGNAYYAMNGVSGHAGLFATARDVAMLARVYLDESRTSGSLRPRLLSSSIVKEAVRCQTNSANPRGLGWMLRSGFPGFGHNGFTGTSVWVFPERRLISVLMTNRLHQQAPRDVTHVMQAYHERVYALVNS